MASTTERNLALLNEETERLRALLDGRGVKWWETTTFIGATITSEGIDRHYLVSTWWVSPVFGRVEATDMGDGVLHMACLNGSDLTPEQAVEATLGSEPDDAAMVKLHERMNAALLEYERAQGIEQRDGDGAIVVPFVAEMHQLLEEAATLGVTGKVSEKDSDECHAEEVDAITCVCDQAGRLGKRLTVHVMECDKCGGTYEHVNGAYEYCPRCGKRVKEDE